MSKLDHINYISDIEAWRDDMDKQMRAAGPWGWLAIVGMHPLKEGINTVGSARNSDILLPEGAGPEQLGLIDFQGQHGILTVTTSEKVTVDGLELQEAKLRNHYEAGGMSLVKVRDLSFGVMQWSRIIKVSIE